ncbi:HAD family phosphatase [candidate division WWE3 bacterium]|jgi:beta-phosphoglucomutase|uniref:HAD family phosphatase n=1 Tax=candidate division WWE3 bacterium TaxID=2053526 RepID=A0A3A4ZJN7_UNCKA|nr:MAG: HAD family phosphatase [candidate division WWE3 bacterium]
MYKKILEGKKAVFFDLDGTLVDTEPMWVAAFEKVLLYVAPGTALEEVYERSGEGMIEKWSRVLALGTMKGQHKAEELVDQTHNEFLKILEAYDLDPMEGFWDLAFELRVEKNIKLALTTNTEEAVGKKILEKLNMSDFFDFVIFGNQVKKKKPAPEIYLTAAKELGVAPQEVLVFEDSIYGAQAAHNANMSLIVIWDGDTAKSNFPEETFLFMENFIGLAGNLDHAPEDIFRAIEKRTEKKA